MQCQDISGKLFLMIKKNKPKIEVQLERETFKLKANKGGGILSFEVWGFVQNGKTVVTRYNLAYINPLICQKDNGRVLGFDNAHDYHHRHYMGKVAPVEFVSYEQTLEQFQEEWQEIVKGLKKVKK
jgi:CHASE1-domain containing sensor protein